MRVSAPAAGRLSQPCLQVALFLFSLASGAALSQTTTQSTFEVATVRRADNATLGSSISTDIGTVRGAQLTLSNATLQDCIRFALGLTSDAQIDGPAWIKSKEFLYDITARAAAPGTVESMRPMLRALLVERFHIQIHSEPRTLSYLALIPAKHGTTVHPAPAPSGDFHGKTWPGRIDSVLSMNLLAYLLSRFDTERPVIDQTGMSGFYEVRLTWSTPRQMESDPSAPAVPLSTAIEEQLGLKLEPRKGPLPVWIVDSAAQIPADN